MHILVKYLKPLHVVLLSWSWSVRLLLCPGVLAVEFRSSSSTRRAPELWPVVLPIATLLDGWHQLAILNS